MTAVEICVPYGRAGTRARGRAGRGGTPRLPRVPGVAWQAWGVIVGIGVDLVDIARLDPALRRTPALAPPLFTPGRRGAPPASPAARAGAAPARRSPRRRGASRRASGATCASAARLCWPGGPPEPPMGLPHYTIARLRHGHARC